MLSLRRSVGRVPAFLPGLGDFALAVDLSLTLRLGPGGALHGNLVGDVFPNAEVFAVGPGGVTMLDTFAAPD